MTVLSITPVFAAALERRGKPFRQHVLGYMLSPLANLLISVSINLALV